MGDHTALATTDPHATQVAAIEGRLADLARGLDSSITTPTNLPVGAQRWNASTERKEKWSGTAWTQRAASWDLSTSGLTFTGTGKRITGDFSSATQSNRLLFQSSTTNGVTNVGAIPNGASGVAAYTVFSNPDASNASTAQIGVSNSTGRAWVHSGKTGTGSALPLCFDTDGLERARIETDGRFSYKNFSAFRAYVTSGQTSGTQNNPVQFSNLTGAADYSTSTYTATAPRTGWYDINTRITVVNTESAAKSLSFRMAINSELTSEITDTQDMPAGEFSSHVFSIKAHRYLTAGDTVKINFGSNISGIEILPPTSFSWAYLGD